MNYKLIIPALLTIAMTTTAAAQVSEITGTLTTGTSSNSSLTGTVTTTPGTGTLEGTVVSPSSGGGGGGGSSGGSGGGGGSSGGGSTSDMCPNIPDFQTIIPGGFVLVNGNCVLASGAGIPNTGTPGIPNTGAGGALATMLSLLASGTLALGSGMLLRRRT